MKEIALTNTDKICLVDDEDFEWLNTVNWNMTRDGYVRRNFSFGNKALTILIHRLIATRYWSLDPTNEMDHLDLNPLNNQKHNLRLVAHGINCRNTLTKNPTGYRGVRYRYTGTYQSYINIAGKQHNLGTYQTAEDAAMAYDKAAYSIFGTDFKRFNLLKEADMR